MISGVGPTIGLPKGWPKVVRSGILHVVALAHSAIVHARGFAANSSLHRVRLATELDEAKAEIALLREEMRIKDARILRLDPRRRPHFEPTARLAILALRAARCWSASETARRFGIERKTIAAWTKRLDEAGEDALVKTPEPVNRFPDFVREVVMRLRATCPRLGSKRIADTLARAGLHLAASTVKRMLKRRDDPPRGDRDRRPSAATERPRRPVTARAVHHTWQVDLTVVPTRLGFWVPWFAFSLAQTWPFCWWVALVIDHFSRRVVGFAVFPKQPTSIEVRTFIGRAIASVGSSPKYLVSDLGAQFDNADFRGWCERRAITPRYASKDSIRATAIVERFFLSLKSELLAGLSVSLDRDRFRSDVTRVLRWYHDHRPHQGLAGRTPAEVFEGLTPAHRRPRYEPRTCWPANAPCAKPHARARRNSAQRLELVVHPFEDDARLPVIQLRRAS